MHVLSILLLIFALVFFVIAGLGLQPQQTTKNYVALGLACWVLTLLLPLIVGLR